MEWFIALAGMALAGVVSYWMGVRTERGRHARWDAIQEVQRTERQRRGGIVLKRLRVGR